MASPTSYLLGSVVDLSHTRTCFNSITNKSQIWSSEGAFRYCKTVKPFQMNVYKGIFPNQANQMATKQTSFELVYLVCSMFIYETTNQNMNNPFPCSFVSLVYLVHLVCMVHKKRTQPELAVYGC